MTQPHTSDVHISVGLVTVSDTCSTDPTLDKSGPTAVKLLRDAGFVLSLHECVPDDRFILTSTLLNLTSSNPPDIIFTLGGTGLTNRDITPDVVLSLIDHERRIHGLEHFLYRASFDHTPLAALSRFVAGIRNQILIITLPGSCRAVSQCIPVVIPILKHAVAQIKGWHTVVQQDHEVDSYNKKPDDSIKFDILSNASAIVNRSRQSTLPMLSVEDALAKVFHVAELLIPTAQCVEAVHYHNALGRVLARNMKVRQQIPPYDASIMDGYAIRFEDQAGKFHVLGTICAGDLQTKQISLKMSNCSESVDSTKFCYRVSTGSAIPMGFNCVIPVENTRLIGKRSGRSDDPYGSDVEEEHLIEILKPPNKVGEFIRIAGSDLNYHDEFKQGLKLGPVELGLIAGAGILTPWPNPADLVMSNESKELNLPDIVVKKLLQGGYLPCFKQLKIGVLSTGNEIFEETLTVATNCIIRDSNRCLIINLLRQHGYHDIQDFGILRDDCKSLVSGFSRILPLCDLVITTGGVSMGERDLVSQVLTQKFGAIIHFGRIFMKPGKPTTFLSIPKIDQTNLRKATLIFCLPGNPVSAYVTSHLFVLPLLHRLEFRPADQWSFPSIKVKLKNAIQLSDRPDYQRARLIWEQSDSYNLTSVPYAECQHLGSQMSSRLASCLDSDVLIRLPAQTEDQKQLKSGTIVTAFLIKPRL